MLFGGFDINNNAVNTMEIVDLNGYNVKILDSTYNKSPDPRGGHSILKVGSILFLYGGKKTEGFILNDAWKFIIKKSQWIKIREDKHSSFFMARTGMNFITAPNTERPALYGGEFKDKEIRYNDIIIFHFPICQTDETLLGPYACIPCLEGYNFSSTDKECKSCDKGTYHSINMDNYFSSTCEQCPLGTSSNYSSTSSITGCKLCGFNTYANKKGLEQCLECPKDKLCLPGAKEYIDDPKIQENLVEDFYIEDDNNPKIFNYQDDEKYLIWRYHGTFIIFIISVITTILVLTCYKYQHIKFTKFLIEVDFIPVTGGETQLCSGGIITLFYIIFIASMSLIFLIRFTYYNEIAEVIPISYTSQTHSLKLSSIINVELVGYDGDCVNAEKIVRIEDQEKFYGCSDDIEITRVDSLGKSLVLLKKVSCSKDLNTNNNCNVKFVCEDCKLLNNNDKLVIKLKKNHVYVQLFKWSFESVWSDTLDKSNGYSKIFGIFKPNEDHR